MMWTLSNSGSVGLSARATAEVKTAINRITINSTRFIPIPLFFLDLVSVFEGSAFVNASFVAEGKQHGFRSME